PDVWVRNVLGIDVAAHNDADATDAATLRAAGTGEPADRTPGAPLDEPDQPSQACGIRLGDADAGVVRLARRRDGGIRQVEDEGIGEVRRAGRRGGDD